MKLNPIAVTIWIVAGLIGYLITDTFRGAAVGFVVMFIISIVIDVVVDTFRSETPAEQAARILRKLSKR